MLVMVRVWGWGVVLGIKNNPCWGLGSGFPRVISRPPSSESSVNLVKNVKFLTSP